MPEPSHKSPELEEFLEENFGRTTAIEGSRCVPPPAGCGREISEKEFDTWDAETKMEYRMSGLCSNCQDEFFINEEEQ